jgi:hypothetical protein
MYHENMSLGGEIGIRIGYCPASDGGYRTALIIVLFLK